MKRTIALTMVALLVASCDASTAPVASPAASPAATETPIRGGRIVLSGSADAILQPVLAVDSGSNFVIQFIYAPLLENDPAGNLRPVLAQRSESSDDGKRITFTLRDATWSDGVRVTGDDYRYHLEAVARSKRTNKKSNFEDIVGWSDYVDGRSDAIRGISVSGGGSVIEISLERSSCLTLRRLGVPPLPRHHFQRTWDNRTTNVSASIDDSPMNAAPPAASGPFMFKERRPGDQLTLVRNDRYFRGAPLLEEMVFKKLGSADADRNAFVTGDLTWHFARPSDIDYLRQQTSASAREYRFADQYGYHFIAWNQKATRAPWLADKRVRQALWYGLDIKAMLDAVYLGYGQRVYAHTPQPSWAHDASGLNRYEHDPARARTLLESAGATVGADGIYRWTNGAPMEIRIETNSGNKDRESILQIAVQQYRQIGIRVVPVLQAFQTLVNRVTPADGSVEGVILGWGLDADPDAYRMWHSKSQGRDGFNFTGMSDPRLDAALEAGRYGPDCSTAARKKAYQTMDRILNEEAPYAFLFAQHTVMFVSNKLVAAPPQGAGGIPDIEKWWIRP